MPSESALHCGESAPRSVMHSTYPDRIVLRSASSCEETEETVVLEHPAREVRSRPAAVRARRFFIRDLRQSGFIKQCSRRGGSSRREHLSGGGTRNKIQSYRTARPLITLRRAGLTTVLRSAFWRRAIAT